MGKRKQRIKEVPKKTLVKKPIFISLSLIIVLGFAVYANSLDGQFIWDDFNLVKDNTYIRNTSNILKLFKTNIGTGADDEYKFYRPLQMLTYMWDYSFWKLNVTGYHLTNTVLHILVALVLYWLVNIIFKDKLLALLISLLFVVHPIHTEAVAYVSGRADSLAALFIFLCFIFYIKRVEQKRLVFYVLMMASYVLALLSKEYSLILPALILLYHYSFKKKILVKEFLSITALALCFIVIRFTLLKSIVKPVIQETTLFQRLPGLFVALANYLKLMALPFNLHMEHGVELFAFSDPEVILGIILLISLLVYTYKVKKNTLMSFSISWFFIAIFPVSNIYPVNAYMAEHWLYLPSIGFFLILAKGLTILYNSKKFKTTSLVIIISLITFYSILTIRQNNYWQEPVGFFKRTLQYTDRSPRLYNNLGLIYKDANEYEKAIACYKKAIEVNSEYPEVYNNLGFAYKNIGEYEKAITFYNKALEIDPKCAKAYCNLGIVYGILGQYEEAISHYKKAIELDREYAEAYNNLGNTYFNIGKYEQAIPCYNKALEIDPEYTKAYNNLGVSYKNLGRHKEAIAAYEKALKIKPDFAEVHTNLALLYYNKKDYALAIQHCDKAVELGYSVDPKLIEVLKPFRR